MVDICDLLAEGRAIVVDCNENPIEMCTNKFEMYINVRMGEKTSSGPLFRFGLLLVSLR